MPATYLPCLPGKRTPSAIEQPDDAYLRVSGPLGPERPVLHHSVPVPRALTGKSLTVGATVEGRADSKGPGETTGPTRVEIVECRCGSFLNTREICNRCQGRRSDEWDECTCGRGDNQCICVGRCPADWPDDCMFRTTQKVCRTHGNCCMGCDRLLHECTCECDQVYVPNPDILCHIPLTVGTNRRHDAARAA